VLYTSIVIRDTGPYYTSRHQGWSKLHTAFTKLTSKFSSDSQLKIDVKINTATDDRRVPKRYEKPGTTKTKD